MGVEVLNSCLWKMAMTAPLTTSRSTRRMAARGPAFFTGLVEPAAFKRVSGIFFSVYLVPVRMYLTSGPGAWGATIFWKQVGHSMTEPPWVESHIMCWPQTGQANLNSFMGRLRLAEHFTSGAGRQCRFCTKVRRWPEGS